jgi:hypothetical protein
MVRSPIYITIYKDVCLSNMRYYNEIGWQNMVDSVLHSTEPANYQPACKTSSSHKNTEGFNNPRNDIILGSTEDPSNFIESQFLRFFCRVPLGPLKIKNRSKDGLDAISKAFQLRTTFVHCQMMALNDRRYLEDQLSPKLKECSCKGFPRTRIF